MSQAEPSEFARFMARIQAGDEEAAREFWATFGPAVRRMARRWLSSCDLRRVLDSADLQQSVAAEFFRLVQSGDVAPTSAREVVALLRTIAGHRFLKRAKYHRAERRDMGRLSKTPVEDMGLADRRSDPSTVLAQRELQERFFSRLDRLDWWLLDGRSRGRSWPDLAAEACSSADALQMRYGRLVRKVRKLWSAPPPRRQRPTRTLSDDERGFCKTRLLQSGARVIRDTRPARSLSPHPALSPEGEGLCDHLCSIRRGSKARKAWAGSISTPLDDRIWMVSYQPGR